MSAIVTLEIAVPVPLPQNFEYLLPQGHQGPTPEPGVRVKVPFGKREIIGILVAVNQQTKFTQSKLKPAIEFLDENNFFSPKLFELIQWASNYYHYPLGEVFAAALPSLLRQGKAAEIKLKKSSKKKSTKKLPYKNIQLNPAQQHAIKTVLNQQEQFNAFLLQGVTGSGKTEVYIEIVKECLDKNKQALILIPEIGLTPQIVERFAGKFDHEIIVLHSGLTERERLNAWMKAKHGIGKIIIGTRSAIFTPIADLGVVIVDEEHDASFKQQEGFRYHARDLAIMRAHMENIPVILGSATPSLESLHNVEIQRYQLLVLPERTGSATHPFFSLIDLRNKSLDEGLSTELIYQIRAHIQRGGQVLVFLNRRGYAPVLICHACGWFAKCHRCDAKLTIHSSPPILQCHHCGSQRKLDKQCPECSNQQLMPVGLGTQRLEQSLLKHFPDVKVARIDRDTTKKKGELQDILDSIHTGEARILLGTQMLAKGHHFPDVSLVAVLNADSGLYSSDFRATEHVAQLLIQVAGRAGRAEREGEVVIQTHNPDHPLLKKLLDEGYSSFANAALAERQQAELPPHAFIASIRAEAVGANYPNNFLQEIKKFIQQSAVPQVHVLGPAPCLMERKAGRYRAQLLLQSKDRKALHVLLKKIQKHLPLIPLVKKVRWGIDVDPIEIF